MATKKEPLGPAVEADPALISLLTQILAEVSLTNLHLQNLYEVIHEIGRE